MKKNKKISVGGCFKSRQIKMWIIMLIETVAIVFLLQAFFKQHETIAEENDTTLIAENISSDISVDVLEEDIQKIGELATIQYIYTNAAKFTDSEHILDFKIPLTTKSFIVRWDGIVKAGIDTEEIKVKINKKDSEIQVQIPEAEILSHEIDNDSFETLDESSNVFNRITVDDVNSFVGDNKKFMEDRVEDINVLDEATNNAKNLIMNFLSTSDVISDDYTVKVEVE